jgi:hypothetical protein
MIFLQVNFNKTPIIYFFIILILKQMGDNLVHASKDYHYQLRDNIFLEAMYIQTK